ncbi:sel1 repeat family protein [Actinobacillus succinogenes]|uniref:Sel1 domain protein repeat-containing protein n=1 Tax=Actinobacillus succinogenes (strain ATCC 55618 / DSM 22257 / CCUG 43843 / 130Z) TaxID=339671 RepID=A6VLC7_ACTSZ|nr:tetratricopeptide repeat protein [Actinobacillus succinogenes]ABR73774.1 Sel1 domain protein repeat-containing protein [Actinobacillus succinogenes 130Z]PHI39768.1 sel1 repeat family protein [Actinobacillus succinogenes]
MSTYFRRFPLNHIVFTLSSVLVAIHCEAAIVINKPPVSSSEYVPIQAPAAVMPNEDDESDRITALGQAFEAYKRENYSYAYNIFSHYADMSEPHGMLATGYFLFMGYGTAPDYGQAKRYLERANGLGFVRATTLLGLLEQRTNPQPSNQTALRLLMKAANMGDSVAANALANLYYRRGNITDAVVWNEKAIALGSYAAKRNQKNLATAPNRPQQIVSVNNNEHLQKLRQESQAGNGQASYELATRYHKGAGVPQNFGEAIRLYRIAAQQGNEQARKILPIILSKQNASGNSLNSLWMQETSNMVTTPPIVLAPAGQDGKSGKSSSSAAGTNSLAEDDPLENLLLLEPNRSMIINK